LIPLQNSGDRKYGTAEMATKTAFLLHAEHVVKGPGHGVVTELPNRHQWQTGGSLIRENADEFPITGRIPENPAMQRGHYDVVMEARIPKLFQPVPGLTKDTTLVWIPRLVADRPQEPPFGGKTLRFRIPDAITLVKFLEQALFQPTTSQ
jgi:hypothetical protein